MNLEKEWISLINKQRLWDKNNHVLVALSGGVDSIVLTHLLTQLPQNLKPKVSIVHINHQLRKQSDIEAEYIQELAEKLNLPLYLYTWKNDKHRQTNVESAAREMRYNFFAKTMEKQDIPILLTAHHLGDQAETVLMKLTRGGLIEDKIGIRLISKFREGMLIRPLLSFSKKQLYEYAEAKNLKYFEDETNHTDMYLRNRMRRNVIPLLKEENPQVEHHLSDFSHELSDLLKFATPYIQEKKENYYLNRVLYLNDFSNENNYIQRLIMKEIFKELFSEDKSFNKNYIELFFNWVYDSAPNSSLQLSTGIFVQREYDKVVFKKSENKRNVQESYHLKPNHWLDLPDGSQIGLFKKNETKQEKDDLGFPIIKEDIKFPIIVRHRKNGDRMSLKGRGGTKKLKDIFIDQKVPLRERDSAWVIEGADKNIIWLVGYKESQLFNNSITDKIKYMFVYRKSN